MQRRACVTVLSRSETGHSRTKLLSRSLKTPRPSSDSNRKRFQFLSVITSNPLLQRKQSSSAELAATAAPVQKPTGIDHPAVQSATDPSDESNVLSLLGSLPNKVQVTVKNNVVSAKSLLHNAGRIVRLPPTPELESDFPEHQRPTKLQKLQQPKDQDATCVDDFSSILTAPGTGPRRDPLLVTVPAEPRHAAAPVQSWTQPGLHPALRLVRDRFWSGSKPGKRRDGYKLGLVVEGGGMRGIVSGAMLMQLYKLGLRDVFDAVYGASAGAINASYFLAGQAENLDIYTRHINNTDFVNLARLFTNQPVMNLDLLIHVMNSTRALDWDAVLNSPIPLKVVASCLDSLGPVLLENFTDKEDLTMCLRASANVPQIVGPPCEVRGRRLVDAAVFEPVPYRAALKDGCSHLVVLCSRPRCKSSPLKRQLQQTMVSMLKRTVLNPTYMREAWRRELQMLTHNGMHLDDLLALALEGGEQADLCRLHGGFIMPVYPGRPANFPPITRDTATLERGLEEGVRAASAVFAPLVSLEAQLNEAMW